MTDQEAYVKGLVKLGLYKIRRRFHEETLDLRDPHNAAFAWQVLKAWMHYDRTPSEWLNFNALLTLLSEADSAEDYLYAAVCALGREDQQ